MQREERAAGEAPSDPGRGDEKRLPVLIVVHQLQSSPGHIGRWLRMHGFPLDIRRPRFGDPLPQTMDEHAGAVIFGGPMSACDCDDFMRVETDWIEVPLKENKPYLGVCLGAQMLAAKLGAKVAFHPDAMSEIGYHPIRPTQAGRAMLEWPSHVYQWHREGFDLPKDATLLAEGEAFPHQAFRSGENAYALQFHPEIDHHLVNRWTIRASHRLILPGAKSKQEQMDGHLVHGPRQRKWLGEFLRRWIGVDACLPQWR